MEPAEPTPPFRANADDPEILKRALSQKDVLNPEDGPQVQQWQDQGLVVIKG
ncbi:MAG: hypothetical protein LBF24_03790 [Puniceicoccales bacterium]|jgi:hypothetical protein|nr:hypothetical protein [Puniceicoccales bacterium]